ncbi:MAG: DUF1592 domain-containing protein [Pirellula sp.]|nr:DUF1592 domain-containing protein [Pirellula sp.]
MAATPDRHCILPPNMQSRKILGELQTRFDIAMLLAALLITFTWADASSADDRVRSFITNHCADCHSANSPDAGLDLENLPIDLQQPGDALRWTRIVDRVASGEMPPKDVDRPEPHLVAAFLSSSSELIRTFQKKEYEQFGRVPARRLTNLQLERTLHDLLGVDIPLASEMPDEAKTGEFSTNAAGQTISHFQLESHLKVVDLALDEAFRRLIADDDDYFKRELAPKDFTRTRDRCREPECIEDQAIVWSSQLIFYGRIPATTAKSSGWYRIRFQVHSLNTPEKHGVWCSVRTGQCVSSAPLLGWAGSFEATEEPKVVEIVAWLPKGHMFEIRPNDRTLKQAKFAGGQASNGEGGAQNVPGIALDWLTLERVHQGPTKQEVRERLLHGLPIDVVGNGPERRDFEANPKRGKEDSRGEPAVVLKSVKPEAHLAAAMTAFAKRAFRRPSRPEELQRYIDFAVEEYRRTEDLSQSLRSGYRSILCSPRFLYMMEPIGPLDPHAIATRLSYFLWSSMPDEPLMKAADENQLRSKEQIRKQVDRMLATERGKRFILDFADQWLELHQIDFTEPDTKLHPDFDIVVQNSMLEETRTFLLEAMSTDRSVADMLLARDTFLNSRLARFYKINVPLSDRVERVSLTPEHRRIGLLSHGSVLKVTANGTNTSPVLRGLWVSNRVLGDHIPPPPENVPAIEPDVRGATTIRELLEKHRSDPSCASCHVKMDPPGFALENFDAAGRWRERYPAVIDGKVKAGAIIDPSYKTALGESFRDLNDFVRIAASNPRKLGQNFAAKLIVYGTGAPVLFVDRAGIERIVDESEANRFGIKSILYSVVSSDLFLEN